MWSIKYLPLLILVLSPSAFAQRTECPGFSGAASNVLINARLFDGPVKDQVELAPDNEQNATWDVRGYKTANRTLVLVCEYKNRTSISVEVDHSVNQCFFKGKKKAWCN